MQQLIRIATRKSPLALWQAEFVKQQLLKKHKNLTIELVKLSTRGDEILDTSLNRIGGKGLFIKELEKAIISGDADIAVHSLKDMPYKLTEGFEIGAILSREDPRDAFVSNKYNTIDDLTSGSIIGTCSNRRVLQLKSLRPDLKIKDLRGSVNTRLAKLDDLEYDAIILAVAGLKRLNLAKRITQKLNFSQSLPAVGQGAIAIECKKGDNNILELIHPLIDNKTTIEVSAERLINKELMGDCSAPIAIFANIIDNTINIKALVGSLDTNTMLSVSGSDDYNNYSKLAKKLAQKLMNLGAKDILNK